MNKLIKLNPSHKGQRLDLVISNLILDLSRRQIQTLIANNQIKINNQNIKSNYKCIGDEQVHLQYIEPNLVEDLPQEIPINIIYEDNQLLVINKQPGLTVHPGNGQKANTLLNSILFHRPKLKLLPRVGIVHRLDKDTSGLMVIAKTKKARLNLIEQISQRKVSREYLAITEGEIENSGAIDVPISRDPINRTKMTTAKKGKAKNAKNALTYFKVIRRYRAINSVYNLVHCRLASGRTHQIRVHLRYINSPIIGDKTYNNSKVYQNLGKILSRHMLHAFYLRLIHPVNNQMMNWQIDIPEDFQLILNRIKEQVNVS